MPRSDRIRRAHFSDTLFLQFTFHNESLCHPVTSTCSVIRAIILQCVYLYNTMLANWRIIDRKRDDHDHDCVSSQKIGDTDGLCGRIFRVALRSGTREESIKGTGIIIIMFIIIYIDFYAISSSCLLFWISTLNHDFFRPIDRKYTHLFLINRFVTVQSYKEKGWSNPYAMPCSDLHLLDAVRRLNEAGQDEDHLPAIQTARAFLWPLAQQLRECEDANSLRK